jgi:hypothetical protein
MSIEVSNHHCVGVCVLKSSSICLIKLGVSMLGVFKLMIIISSYRIAFSLFSYEVIFFVSSD